MQIKGDLTFTKRVVSAEAQLKETEIKVVPTMWDIGITKLEKKEGWEEHLMLEQ